MRLLAVHGLGHDTGASVYDGGRLVAAVETERLTRVRHDHRATLAVDHVLHEAGSPRRTSTCWRSPRT